MRIKYLSLHSPQIRFHDVLFSSFAGHPKELLEDRLGAYLGSSVNVTGSGRFGLEIVLKSLKVTSKSEVIIPAFICPSVADAVIESGAAPVFADTAKDDINIDPKSVEEAITENTKAIVVAHIFGIPANIDKFLEVSLKYHMPIIEDCGQSFGARYDGAFTGTLGDFGFFSFGISKNISTPGGGAICYKECYHEQISGLLEKTLFISDMNHKASQVSQYLSSFITPMVFNKHAYQIFKRLVANRSADNYTKSYSSFQRGMTNLEAKLVLKQLERYEETMNMRNNNAEVYRKYFGGHFRLINATKKAVPAYLYFPLLTSRVREIKSGLRKQAIEVKDKSDMRFVALYNQPRFNKYKYIGSNAEKVESEYLLFPTGYSRDETQEICRKTLKILQSLDGC